MKLNDRIVAAIRTFVPLLVGWLIQLPAAEPICKALGIDTNSARAVLTSALTVAFAFVYHQLVSALESRWSWIGALLGIPAAPSYMAAAAVSADAALDIPDTPDPLDDVPDPNTPGASTPVAAPSA